VLGKVGEVASVEGQQRQPALDAAGRDPGIVQRPGPSASLRPGSQFTPDRRHHQAGRKDQRLVEEELKTAAAGAAPSPDPGALPQLPGGSEGNAEFVAGYLAGVPGREATCAVA
jgi:hypothetical protein